MRVNELLDAFHIPASLLVGYGSFHQAFQIIIKKARGGVRDGNRGVNVHFYENLPCNEKWVSSPNIKQLK
jgi:hypothetical protein